MLEKKLMAAVPSRKMIKEDSDFILGRLFPRLPPEPSLIIFES